MIECERGGMITGQKQGSVGYVYGLIHNQAQLHDRIQSRQAEWFIVECEDDYDRLKPSY